MDDDKVLWFDVGENVGVERLEAAVPALIPAIGGLVGFGLVMMAGPDTLQSKGLLLPLVLALVSAVAFVELGFFLAQRSGRRISIRRVGFDGEAIYLDRPVGVVRLRNTEVASLTRVRLVGFRLRAKSGDLFWIPQVMTESLRTRLSEWSKGTG